MGVLLTSLRLALVAIFRNKTRAALTVLGILIGVAAVVSVITLSQGASDKVGGQIDQQGTNLVYIFPQGAQGAASRDRAAARLTELDARAIKREAVSVQYVAPFLSITTQVAGGEKNWSTTVAGVTGEYLPTRRYEIGRGSMWRNEDERTGTRVAIVGQTVTKNLFAKGEDPLGQVIRIAGAPFSIIGILTVKGTTATGEDQDDRVLIPIKTFRNRVSHSSPNRVDMIMISATDAKTVDAAIRQASDVLRQRHRIKEGDKDDFQTTSQAEMRAMQEGITGTLSAMLLGVAAVSLLVGGIGVMNIMLVSVTERTREIGIRMSIGARERDILVQFLVEAVVLTLFGGILGAFLGTTATTLVAAAFDWPLKPSFGASAIALGTSTAIGLAFGFFPAQRAARLDPIDALRSE